MPSTAAVPESTTPPKGEVPEDKTPSNHVLSTLAGFVIIGLIIYGVFVAGRALYYRFSPPATLSLVADLEEVSSGRFALHVIGGVQRSGQPASGQVVLSVQKLWEGSPQTIHLPVASGKFELRQNPQFTFNSKDERLLISAQAWITELSNRPAETELYLNATGPWRYKRLLWSLSIGVIVLLAIAFFGVFTGRGSPFKNRMAIVFSYCIMLLFLAIPLTVTNIALVLAAPDFRRMEQAPVGILIAKPWGAKAEEPPQWVLNIGGHAKPLATPAVAAGSAPITSGVANTGTVNPASPANPPAVANSDPSGSPIEPRELEGGIAIPFYVLVLAVIGGAINMARQIPKYHQEGEQSVLAFTPLQSAAAAVRAMLTTKSLAENREAGSDTPLSSERPGDSSWRKGLLDQYMYLISAPLLAIITYFLLAWLGVTTVPALVLVSFSVGLITEPVIQRIIAAAQSTIGGKNGKEKEKVQLEEEDSKKAVETDAADSAGQGNAQDSTALPDGAKQAGASQPAASKAASGK